MKKIKEKRELSVKAKDSIFSVILLLIMIILIGTSIYDANHQANKQADKVHSGCHCGSAYHFYYSDNKYNYYYKCDNGHVIRTSHFIPT